MRDIRRLKIDIAKRPAGSVKQLTNRPILSQHTKILHVVEGRIRRIRNSKPRKDSRALNNKSTIARLQILPRPEDTIDGRVVQIEDRVTGGRKEVTRRITADGVVAAAVHAEIFIGKVTLETVLEGRDIRALEQIHHFVDCRPGRRIGVEIAAQATGVVVQPCSILVFQPRYSEGGRDGPEIHLEAVDMSVRSRLFISIR